MSEDILINITPQETRVALLLQGAVQELHIESTLSRGLAGNIYLGKVVRVLPGMQSAFIDIGLERAAFLHVADIWESRPHDGQNNPHTPIEKLLYDGQIGHGAGDQGADRHQGRAAVDADFASPAACWCICRRTSISASRSASKTKPSANCCASKVQALLPPEEKGGFIIRTMAEDASDLDLQMDVEYLRKTWSAIVQLSKSHAGADPAASGPESGAARTARFRQRNHHRHPDRLARKFPETAGVRRAVHAIGIGTPEPLQGRTAAVRPVWRRRGNPARFGPARRSEIRRLPDHRPDRSA